MGTPNTLLESLNARARQQREEIRQRQHRQAHEDLRSELLLLIEEQRKALDAQQKLLKAQRDQIDELTVRVTALEPARSGSKNRKTTTNA